MYDVCDESARYGVELAHTIVVMVGNEKVNAVGREPKTLWTVQLSVQSAHSNKHIGQWALGCQKPDACYNRRGSVPQQNNRVMLGQRHSNGVVLSAVRHTVCMTALGQCNGALEHAADRNFDDAVVFTVAHEQRVNASTPGKARKLWMV
jgi:hypothetical protein